MAWAHFLQPLVGALRDMWMLYFNQPGDGIQQSGVAEFGRLFSNRLHEKAMASQTLSETQVVLGDG